MWAAFLNLNLFEKRSQPKLANPATLSATWLNFPWCSGIVPEILGQIHSISAWLMYFSNFNQLLYNLIVINSHQWKFSNPICTYLSNKVHTYFLSIFFTCMHKTSFLILSLLMSLLHAVSDYKKRWSEVSAGVS